MRFYWLLLGILSVWRITHLLNAEDGPGDVLVRLRQRVGSGFWGSLVDCFNCLSLWVAAPFAYLLGEAWFEQLLLWPSFSAAAILLERLTSGRATGTPPASYFEDTEESNVVLRQTENAVPGEPPGRPGEQDGAVRPPP